MKKNRNCKHFREKIEKVQSKMWILDIDDQGLSMNMHTQKIKKMLILA